METDLESLLKLIGRQTVEIDQLRTQLAAAREATIRAVAEKEIAAAVKTEA